MAISSVDKKDMDIIINMVEQKKPLDMYYDMFDDARLVELLKKLRKVNYRVFLGTNDFEETLVSTNEYMKQMGYYDSITNDGSDLKICVISDLHLGSARDEIMYVEKAWEICSELGIRHILNLGDIAEGSEYLSDGCRKLEDYKHEITRTLENQVAYLNKYVPNDKNITHHLLYGNHDLYSSDGISIDLSRAMKESFNRSDLIVCGVEDNKFKINNDYIHLFHHSFPDIIKPYVKKIEGSEENEIILAGHSHVSKTYSGHAYDLECIPTLSKVDHHLEDFPFFSGFVILNISFDKNLKMSNIYLQRYRFDNVYTKPVCFHSHDISVRRLTK